MLSGAAIEGKFCWSNQTKTRTKMTASGEKLLSNPVAVTWDLCHSNLAAPSGLVPGVSNPPDVNFPSVCYRPWRWEHVLVEGWMASLLRSCPGRVRTWTLQRYIKWFVLAGRHVSSRSGPTATFQRRVEAGELHTDEYQARVIEELETVYNSLSSYKPSGALLRLFFKTKAPKGLYIYGSVGGGKTMLMDLFYDCCQVRERTWSLPVIPVLMSPPPPLSCLLLWACPDSCLQSLYKSNFFSLFFLI